MDLDTGTAETLRSDSNIPSGTAAVWILAFRNLPRHVNRTDVKKFMRRSSCRVHSVKKIVVHGGGGFVTYDCTEDLEFDLCRLKDATWKGTKLCPYKKLKAEQGGCKDNRDTATKEDSADGVTRPDSDKKLSILEVVTPLASLSYKEQLSEKQSTSTQLLSALSEKIKGVSGLRIPHSVMETIRPSLKIAEYRNKCEFTVGFNSTNKAAIGFRVGRAKDGTDVVLPTDCTHISKGMKMLVENFQQFLNTHTHMVPYDLERQTGIWRQLTVRTTSFDVMVIVTVYPCAISDEEMAIIKKQIVDLFIPSGTIGVWLAKAAQRVIGIELCEDSILDAKVNCESNGFANKCEYYCGKAEDVLVDLLRKGAIKDERDSSRRIVAVLDPPRAGLPDKIIGAIRDFAAIGTLCYVSCDPTAASKNFADLCRSPSNKFPGFPFRIQRIVPVDMFPQTRHVEWVMLFKRL